MLCVRGTAVYVYGGCVRVVNTLSFIVIVMGDGANENETTITIITREQ